MRCYLHLWWYFKHRAWYLFIVIFESWNMFQLKTFSAWGGHRPPIWQKSNIATQPTTALVQSCTYFSVDWRTPRWCRWSIPYTGPNIIEKVHLVGLLTSTAHTRSEHLKAVYFNENICIAAKGRPSALLTKLFTTFSQRRHVTNPFLQRLGVIRLVVVVR